MASAEHHHRNTTKFANKPFKPRFTSKGTLKDRAKGKVERLESNVRKTPHQQVMSKLDRRNQAKQKRILSHQDHVKSTSIFAGRDGAPRVVAVIPLCDDVDTVSVIRTLNESVEAAEISSSSFNVWIERFKQKLSYIVVDRKILDALDASRVADYVLFVLSPEREVDERGEAIIRAVEGQGLSTVYTAVQGLGRIQPVKRQTQVTASLKSFITHFLPAQEKVFSLDSHQERQNMVRSLCTTLPKGIRWRDDRTWMHVDDIQWSVSPQGISPTVTTGDVVLTGVVRGRSLKADRLVQVGDWGSFRIHKITAAALERSNKGTEHRKVLESGSVDLVLDQPTHDQDTLETLAPEEVVMDDMNAAAPSTTTQSRKGVLLDDQHYYSEDDDEEQTAVPRRLPRGTSNYQAAWYLGDASESGSDLQDAEEEDADMAMHDIADGGDGPSDGAAFEPTEGAPSEYPQSEMFLDPSPEDEAEALASFRAQKNTEAQDDLRFPDEIELHPNVLARERLARYRGLKSLKTSTWETEEDRIYEPDDWARLLEINDYKSAKSRVTRETLIGGVKPGTRVHIHLTHVPYKLAMSSMTARPHGLFSLLRHEHKQTAVNYSITLDSSITEPIKSKEELIVQCGSRRLVINPLFSHSGVTPNDVHKFERYLHPGRTAVASFVAPLTWGSLPVLYFRREKCAPSDDAGATMDLDDSSAEKLTLIGHGTSLPPSTSRIIAKRIVLTGDAYKIHRRLVTVRYMFFNTEDVAWFKALQLWTNHGRQGQIKDSLGTHGYFKAMFDGKVGPQDAIGISLYKRMWPRFARAFGAEATEPAA